MDQILEEAVALLDLEVKIENSSIRELSEVELVWVGGGSADVTFE
jgi:hypothetical protein